MRAAGTGSWWSRSIGARIAALSLGLLLAIQVASFGAIRAGLAEHARQTLPGRLEVGERVLASLVERRAQTLRQGAAVLAADYGFKTAVLSNDAETIASALANHGARLGATETALLGTDFKVRASGSANRDLGPAAARVAGGAVGGSGSTSTIAVLGGQPHLVVLTPMKAPLLVGWVLVGFQLDHELVADMTSLAALHLTILTRAPQSPGWHPVMSGESPERALAFAQASGTGWAAVSGSRRGRASTGAAPPPDAPGLHELVIGEERFAVRLRQLAPDVLAVVSVSIDAATQPPPDLQIGLAAITLIGFVVFVAGSLVSAQRVTVPLRDLSIAAERLGRGDGDTPVEGTARADEIGQLAQSFERMRISIGEKQAQVERLAYWDALTGLPNRARFREAVAEAIEAAERRRAGVQAAARKPGAAGDLADARSAEDAEAGTASRNAAALPTHDAAALSPAAGPHAEAPLPATVAIVMLDLDRFKHVNDILGYRVGDLLLQRVAERLARETVRSDDLVARLGGDEFALLLPGADLASAQAVAARIGRAFDEPLVLEDHTVDMGAGIGIACWPEHAADADLLLGRAELAMYTAKRRTEGPLCYDASFDACSAQTLSLLSELRRAVEQGELRLYLQPKLALASGRVHGAEALVRWAHPTRGLVPPIEFIPFAEQTGFIRTLTIWVFEEAARHWLALRQTGLVLTLSINLSTRDLLDLELPQKFAALLGKHRVPATSFCLEITESAIMDDPERALATLERLSALGFRLSIDDFGTGYSSLAYLKRLPVDELKIDRSFVMNMVDDADDAKIVRSTIDLAHNLGLTVVAEGVENARVFDALRELACDEAQGYYMGKPMPAVDFTGWSAAWTAKHRSRGPAVEAAVAVLH